MSKLSIEDVKKNARLSGLSISDEEAKRYQQEFQAILEYVEQLDAVDTSGLEPTYQVTGLSNVTRDDEVIDYGLSRAQLLENAPEHQDGALKVERVL